VRVLGWSVASAVEALLLVLTGVLAGVAGSVVGLASLISFPVLLALGLPAVAANVTNTVALGFTGVGAAAGSRRELTGQGRLVARLAGLTSLGGAAGAALLLLAPARVFALVAPWLVGAGALVILVPPRLRRRVGGHRPGLTAGRLGAMTATAVYTGYFGAAAGVVNLAVLSAMLPPPIARVNAIKNVVQGAANLVAATGFAVFGPVDWGVAAPLAVGYLGGGWLGPALVRRLPGESLRVVVGTVGLLVAGYLAVQAYTAR
jgi:uncharacterized membrane protein YfcA